MEKALQAQLTTFENEVQAAAFPEACKQTTVWCTGQLPALYAKFRQTNESRYGDEITRLVQWMLKRLVQSSEACREGQKLEARLIDRLRLLHERFGLPPLNLKPYRAPPHRPGKAG